MVRYFFAWIPIVVVGTLVILSLPWLGLIALMVALALVAALAWEIVSVPYRLGRAIGRRHGRSGASPRTASALSPASSGVRRTRSLPAGAAVLLADRPSERET
jgi:hypothetical protein